MTSLRQAAQQALDVMNDVNSFERWSEAKEALRAALAEPVQEPVAWTEGHCIEKRKPGGCQLHNINCGYPACDRRPTHPPQRPAEPVQEPVASTWRSVLPGGRRTDEWESARIADYNAGWNAYRKAATSALEKLGDDRSRPVVEFRGRRMTPDGTRECWGVLLCDVKQDPPEGTKLYTAPPRCPNCASLEAQNNELDRKLAELERAEPAQEAVADHFPDGGKMVQDQVAWTDRERRVVRFALKWFISGALQRHAAAAADLRGMWFKPGDDLKFYQDAKDADSALAKMGAAEPLGAPGGGHSAAPSLDNHSPRG